MWQLALQCYMRLPVSTFIASFNHEYDNVPYIPAYKFLHKARVINDPTIFRSVFMGPNKPQFLRGKWSEHLPTIGSRSTQFVLDIIIIIIIIILFVHKNNFIKQITDQMPSSNSVSEVKMS